MIKRFLKREFPLLPFIAVFSFIGIFILSTCSTQEATVKSAAITQEVIPDVVDFNFHVKPILSDRCFTCHGPDEQKVAAGLALHVEEKAFVALGDNKDHFAIVAGDVEKSTLVDRIYSDDPEQIMPPPESNLTLSDYEKAILKKWIAQGAQWKQHWAFTPPTKSDLPSIQTKEWIKNPVDQYILAKIEANGAQPSPAATPAKLLRKLSFDLTGLPPSIEDIRSFSENPSEENYQAFIQQYLNSPAYAERMTSDWLDLARYADTHGYQDDLERVMWPWRDWVIHAYRQNMPYDQFVIWQLAGDLLPNATKEQVIATAFNRNHKITQEGGVISEEYRAEYVTDRTNTFGMAFLGLTMECAKCHDHKYDPISQKEYFQLYSFFNNVPEKGLIEAYGAIPEPYIKITDEEIKKTLTFINNLDTLKEIPLMVMEELPTPRQGYILQRGQYDAPGEKVAPTVPSLGGQNNNVDAKNRLDLANWLFEKDNPLTARVAVNRVWKQLFGKGLVETSFDFGNQGSLPTHPELLDHLALKYINDGWDTHQLITYIVSSATYRQSSKISDELLAKDPSNQFFARTERARLTAEMIRDHALSISGLLVKKVGGPSVKPYQPPGLWAETTGGGGGSTAKYVQGEGEENYRRSLYTFWKRTLPPPNMMTFDTPSRDLCNVQRENTSTPLQALVLLNDPQFLEASRALAERARKAENDDVNKVVHHMFTLATSRAPSEEELATLVDLYQEELQVFKNKPSDAELYLSEAKFDKADAPSLAAFTFVANTIFNLDETIRKS